MKKRSTMSRCKMPFPWKLYQLLEDAEEKEYSNVISWSPDGRSFQIHEIKVFTKTVMKQYFRQQHFRSFTRQLYIYGFAKARCPSRMNEQIFSLSSAQVAPDPSCFAHPAFIRGNKASCLSLRRNQGQEQHLRRVTIDCGAKSKCAEQVPESKSPLSLSLLDPCLPPLSPAGLLRPSEHHQELLPCLGAPPRCTSDCVERRNYRSDGNLIDGDGLRSSTRKAREQLIPADRLSGSEFASLLLLGSFSTHQLSKILEPRPIEEMLSDAKHDCLKLVAVEL